jgi:ArsR family transcriptional regulator, arsenate/arsenite/antimonite-responsive transcriptional repressor
MPAQAPHFSTRAAQIFHALSDETRIGIVELLVGGERCVCELQDTLDAAQSRLSFHLKVLKDAGIVNDRREGRWSYYELNREAFEEAEEMIRELRPRGRRLPVRASGSVRPASARQNECCD